jgi:2-dehydropantoate 2-reductase
MRIAVVGAGAMGGVFGARLADTDADVLLVDASTNVVSAIETKGLRLVCGDEERAVRARATTNPYDEPPCDYVVFFVKNYHTSAAAELVAPLIDDATTVVSLQNGWGNGDVLAAAFGADRVLVGVTYNSATVLEPGRIAHTAEGPTVLGPLTTAMIDGAETFADVLRAGGLTVRVSDEVRRAIWEKLTLNAATLPTAALTRLTAGALGQPGTMLDLVDALALETVAVANASGLAVDAAERLDLIHAALAKAGPGKASMLQDIEANRRTEIDVINGAVVREGQRTGVPTPLNETLYALVTGLERGLGLQ